MPKNGCGNTDSDDEVLVDNFDDTDGNNVPINRDMEEHDADVYTAVMRMISSTAT